MTLIVMGADALGCRDCGRTFRRENGIWRMLLETRAKALGEFVARYEAVRMAEGRRAPGARLLRQLPFRTPSKEHGYEWHIRSRSYRAFLRHVVLPAERANRRALRGVDLGSGLGWLAYRLASRGHDIAAVDLLVNDYEGLAVHRHFDRRFLSIQAEFDRLPLGEANVDLVVFNASFHYAENYERTLSEALRVLAPGGSIVILDTPIYRGAASGVEMVRGREADFERRHGFHSPALRGEGFLTYDRLAALGKELRLRWDIVEPWYGLRWRMKPWMARLRGAREPARFKLMTARRVAD
jgi:SAM-dependent methyltransferase